MSACGRRLPKTPSQPPGTIIVIENVLPAGTATTATAAPPPPPINSGKGKQLPTRPHAPPPLERSGSSAAVERIGGGGIWSTSTSATNHQRSFSLPRKGNNTQQQQRVERPQGTGRRLPLTPNQAQGALPLQNAPKPRAKRELPKPQSLELRHSNHEYMNISNAILGLVKSNSNNRSMNFPRLEGSPTHSECSSGSPPIRHSASTRGRHQAYSHQHSNRRRPMDY